jgi:magnesium-transporting ATPase (P-type)
MLTGDQKLTAKSIAQSCKMITSEYDVTEFDEEGNFDKIINKLEDINRKLFFQDFKKKLSILIGTDDINSILNNEELKDKVKKIKKNM